MSYNAIQRNRFSCVNNYETVPTLVWVLACVIVRDFVDKKRFYVAELWVCYNRRNSVSTMIEKFSQRKS